MSDALVTIFGGTGFVGRAVIRRLCAQGYYVRAAVRDPHKAQHLRRLGAPGQVQIVQANLRFADSLAPACVGAFAVINCAGISFEKGPQTFAAVHVRGPGLLADAARAHGVSRFIQLSVIGADEYAWADYPRSKGQSEAAVREGFADAIVLRASLILGEDDGFLSRFGAMAASLHVLPLPEGGHTRLQPIYVGDVARAVEAALQRADAPGRTFELGGPRILSFKQMMQIVARETQRKVWLAPVPKAALAPLSALAALVRPAAETAHTSALWFDMLRADSVVTVSREPEVNSIRVLGINDLSSAEDIAAAYLWRFRASGQFEAAHS